jgi:hypothetical protein
LRSVEGKTGKDGAGRGSVGIPESLFGTNRTAKESGNGFSLRRNLPEREKSERTDDGR